MWGRFVVISLFLGVTPSVVIGAEATIGGVAIKLPAPAGFCDLSISNASDKRMLDIIGDLLTKSGNKLLGYSADCRQLTDWRTGKRKLLDDYMQYQTALATMNSSAPPEPIQQTCATLRAEGEKILSNDLPDLKARAEKAIKNLKINETTFIGVLNEEPTGCYAGIIQSLRTEVNTEKTQVSVFAATIIKNKAVFVYRFAIYQNPDSVSDLLNKLKVDVAALYAANR
jgi:hypothetical protein